MYMDLRSIIKEEVKKAILKEGRSNYWPGSSDDGTADYIGDLQTRKNIFDVDVLSKKLDALEKRCLKPASKSLRAIYDNQSEDESIWWGKESFCNIVTTLLQYGYPIKRKYLEKVLDYYKEIIADKNHYIDKMWDKSQSEFKATIPVIINGLENLLEEKSKDEIISAPDFMGMDNDDRKVIAFKEEGMFGFLKLNIADLNSFILDKFSDEELKNIVIELYKYLEKDIEWRLMNLHKPEEIIKNVNKMDRKELKFSIIRLLGGLDKV